jgi:uncharacterized membrane protein
MASFENRIAGESRAWVADGLVTEEQAAAIRARYAGEAKAERRGRLVTALSLLGALAVGAGVILFFAANWSAIPKAARLVVLLAALSAALLGGDRLRATYPRVGEAVRFLGGLLFGGSIFLVGQMYNVSDDLGLGFLLWSAGAAAGTLVFRTAPWAALTAATFGTWLGFEVGDWNEGDALPFVIGLYGLGLYALATRLRALDVSGLVRGVGLAAGCIPAYALTFGHLSDDVADAGIPHRVVVIGGLTGLGALLAAGALALDRTRATARWEALGIAAAVALLLVGTRVPLSAIAFNGLVIALALGALAIGYENDEVWLVNVGVLLGGLELVTRFFDWFWHFLPRSAAFLAMGVFLLALAWLLERQRSKLVARIRS